MKNTLKKFRTLARKVSLGLICVLAGTTVLPPAMALAQTRAAQRVELPAPGTRVERTAAYQPALLRGLTVHPDQPLQFDFLIDPGQSPAGEEALRLESARLIKYFLAALAVPDDQLWVNLSPYESDRIIPGSLGETELGRDMLAQDYLLKQLTASMIYPEDALGAAFWERVYQRAQNEFGATDIPLNTFNKVWIVPERAAVSVHEQSVFVVDCHLKVMLEEDYLALAQHTAEQPGDPDVMTGVTSAVVREVLLPEIEKEINTGATFANLRQIFHSVILASWYKQNLRESVLGQAYADQNRTEGIQIDDPAVNRKIYEQYLVALKKGVFDYIREEKD
ncbi:MAG: hypothetical protein K8I00_08215, partial [Candidatus Omnitrophica bacterium]|nr:hypothetical protein [Candidatus Omnitrophota bacterium]